MQVTFVMFKADGTRRDFPLSKERIVIGRKNTCDLRVPLSSVSRQHCEVRIADQAVRIKDLGSSNGTYHNSIRVQEATLAPGDEIVIGPVVFIVVIDGEPERVEPSRSDLAAAASAAANTVMDQSPALGSLHTDDDDDAPKTLVDHAGADNEDLLIEPESSSPTVDLDDEDDDDPIAALERMAEAERAAGGKAASDDSEFDFLIHDDEDDDRR